MDSQSLILNMEHGMITVMYRNEPKAEVSVWVAQLVEHLTCKQGVVGLILDLGE